MQKEIEKIFLSRLICQDPVSFAYFKCTRHYMICGCLDLAEEFIFKLIKYGFLVADTVYFKDKNYILKKYYKIQYKNIFLYIFDASIW